MCLTVDQILRTHYSPLLTLRSLRLTKLYEGTLEEGPSREQSNDIKEAITMEQEQTCAREIGREASITEVSQIAS